MKRDLTFWALLTICVLLFAAGFAGFAGNVLAGLILSSVATVMIVVVLYGPKRKRR